MTNEFKDEEIEVVAGSVDSLETTQEWIDEKQIDIPMAYGLNAESMVDWIGGYYEEEKKFLHPANFIIRPDKTIEVACYSSGAIGRFVAGDVYRLIRLYKSRRNE